MWSPERLQDLLHSYGDAVFLLRLDVTDYDAAARAVAQAEETFGRIDVVVNNAGCSDLGSFEDTTIDSFRTQIDTNFYGVVNVSKAAVPVLREQGSGHIFQVSSLSVRLSAPGLTAYQAAKWAVAGFSSGLAQEIAPFGVKVVSPKWCATWPAATMHRCVCCSAPMPCRWRSRRRRSWPPATRPGEKSV
jgi:NAD(P)-dependent dehydrogenase (short-subunit alcohol dehydrogenase family)